MLFIDVTDTLHKLGSNMSLTKCVSLQSWCSIIHIFTSTNQIRVFHSPYSPHFFLPTLHRVSWDHQNSLSLCVGGTVTVFVFLSYNCGTHITSGEGVRRTGLRGMPFVPRFSYGHAMLREDGDLGGYVWCSWLLCPHHMMLLWWSSLLT